MLENCPQNLPAWTFSKETTVHHNHNNKGNHSKLPTAANLVGNRSTGLLLEVDDNDVNDYGDDDD